MSSTTTTGSGMNSSTTSGNGMNSNESTNGGGMNSNNTTSGNGMGGTSGNRNPKAGQTAYKSVSVDVAFSSPTKAVVHFELPEPVQCSVAYGNDSRYGTLRTDKTMTGPEKRHQVPISTTAGTNYHARLNLFDNSLDALQTGDFTFTAPQTGSAKRSSTQTLTYVETKKAESHLSKHPNLDVGKQTVTVAYETSTPTLGAVQFQQGMTSTTRRDQKAAPHESHTVTIDGLDSGTQTTWAIGLIEPDASMYTTVGMSFDTK